MRTWTLVECMQMLCAHPSQCTSLAYIVPHISAPSIAIRCLSYASCTAVFPVACIMHCCGACLTYYALLWCIVPPSVVLAARTMHGCGASCTHVWCRAGVKRVVTTSSFATIIFGHDHTVDETPYTDKSWNNYSKVCLAPSCLPQPYAILCSAFTKPSAHTSLCLLLWVQFGRPLTTSSICWLECNVSHTCCVAPAVHCLHLRTFIGSVFT